MSNINCSDDPYYSPYAPEEIIIIHNHGSDKIGINLYQDRDRVCGFNLLPGDSVPLRPGFTEIQSRVLAKFRPRQKITFLQPKEIRFLVEPDDRIIKINHDLMEVEIEALADALDGTSALFTPITSPVATGGLDAASTSADVSVFTTPSASPRRSSSRPAERTPNTTPCKASVASERLRAAALE